MDGFGFVGASEIVSNESVSADTAVSVLVGDNIKSTSVSVLPLRHGQTNIRATAVQVSLKKLFYKADV